MLFEITGNQNNPGKAIETGQEGTTITTSPGWKVTVWADIDGDGVLTEIMTTNINGTVKATLLDDGSTHVFYNGHNLTFDPATGGDPNDAWYKFLTGHFNWTGDVNGDTVVFLMAMAC